MQGNLTILTQEGKRLDHVLPDVMHASRSFVQRQITRGAITVNGKTIVPHYFVKAGDVIAWDFVEEKTSVAPNADITVPILFEDDDLLVVEKPAGLVVHQGDGHRGSDTLVNWLLHVRPTVQGIGDDPLRPGIVHRLDRSVSGVMVIAKTKAMYDHLLQLFSRGEVTKEYEGIVYGNVAQPEATLTFPLARSKTKGWKIAARPTKRLEAGLLAAAMGARSPASSHDDEREAITHIVRMSALQHYTHLRILPATGRMHQIRVHCAAFGHPIVGDALYAGKALHPERAPRLFLHATQLTFTDYRGEQRTFTSKLPDLFADFLRQRI